MLTLIATLSLILVGCKKPPTANTVNSVSYAIGVSVALVLNQVELGATEKNAITEIVALINTATPTSNTTFTVAWAPIAENYLTKLVTEGKLAVAKKNLISSLFTKATQTLDYIVYKKYPELKANVELVAAATHGFCNGFLSLYNTTVNKAMSAGQKPDYDKDAYNYFDSLIKDVK